MDLLRTPIAAVDPSYVEDALLPSVAREIGGPLREGGILLIAVDAGREGDYVLGRISSWAPARGLECKSVVAAGQDPFLVWADLVGDADTPGSLVRGAGVSLALIWNSWVVPAGLLGKWVQALEGYARAAGTVVVACILHATHQELTAVGSGLIVIQIPAFRRASETRRRDLCMALLGQELGQSSEVEATARQLLDRIPASRTELEHWVERVVGLFREGQPVDFGAVCRRFPTRPPVAIGREALRSLLIAADVKLSEADAAFQAWQGRPLIQPRREPHDPFDARDTLHWFVGVISSVSSRLDRVDGAFWRLVRLRKEASAAPEVVAVDEPPFLRVLRSLRTLFQHGLDMRDRKDRETVAIAETWFQDNAGAAEPRREHWRQLTWAFLTQWDAVASALRDVALVVASCSAREAIEDELGHEMRRLGRHQWRELARTAIDEIDPGVDADQFMAKRHEEMAAMLRSSAAAPDHVLAVADEIVRRAVAAEAAVCPLEAKDLLALGIAPGPVLGKALSEAYRLWDSDPHIGKVELLLALRVKYGILVDSESSS